MNLNGMANGLNYPIEYTGAFDFERPPLKQAFVDDTSSYWPVGCKAKVLCNTSNEQFLILLLFLIKRFLRFVLYF